MEYTQNIYQTFLKGVRMSSIHITLSPDEREALVKLALAELRVPRDQVRYVIRQELTRRGLLTEGDGPARALTVRAEGNFSQMANLPG